MLLSLEFTSAEYYQSYTRKELRKTSAVKLILSEKFINDIYINKILPHSCFLRNLLNLMVKYLSKATIKTRSISLDTVYHWIVDIEQAFA